MHWLLIGTLLGQAIITDGDTIRIGNERIRLYGIDSPEQQQTCLDEKDEEWSCGKDATEALRRFIGNSEVYCQQKDIDRYGRIVAVCFKDGQDINEWMVSNGWAVAYRRYSLDYVDEEMLASSSGVGIWRGKFELPEEWRMSHP